MCNGERCKTKEERLAVIRKLADCLNLDGFTIDPDKLMDVWAAIHFHPVICARILFPDRPKRYVSVTQDLGNYACNKSCAMGLRLDGKINNAFAYKHACEIIYKNLPDWARW
ncbi:MAG: hypothetical protein ACWGQW_03200 [bacterium]